MQDFTGAKPNIDTLCVENTKLIADIEELEANNSALTAETDKLSTQYNIFGNALRSTTSKKNQAKKKLKHSTVKKGKKTTCQGTHTHTHKGPASFSL